MVGHRTGQIGFAEPRRLDVRVATFGGTTSKQGVIRVIPTVSQTISQVTMTPVGRISVFGFKAPIPYPFGSERTGYWSPTSTPRSP